MDIDRSKFYVDTPLTKAAETPRGDLKLLGYASTWSLDRDNEIVHEKAFDGTIERYLKENPILLWQHDLERPIGRVEAATVDRHGLHVRADVPRPSEKEPDWNHLAYNKIKAGIVKTFSIGGFFKKQIIDKKKFITGVDLFEISVVSVPSNPDSIFQAAVKSLSGESKRPELLTAHVAQMKQLLGMETVSDPDLASMDETERKERYEEIAKVYKSVGKLPPGFDSWHELAAELEQRNDDPLERAAKVAALIQRVQGYVSDEEAVKAGRVVSRANEARLRAAYEAIAAVLDLIDHEAVSEDDPEDVEDPATAMTRE
jgi:HK97 family phage prohead protease